MSSAISFIVTTYNIASYVEKCLDSVARIARPGDEVIVVDDGSDDGTSEMVRSFAEERGFVAGVAFRPVYLGVNTYGGVGIGGNVGMSEATRDTVFFVDGDDWVDAEGFERARARWTLDGSEIMFANYRVYDQAGDRLEIPADAQLWAHVDRSAPYEALQKQALAFIAVPWRKFYRRDFLIRENIRFPEGDFFFEDNPFHWDACLRARSISFCDEVICYHRINRPGQTMASTGAELAAFFTHFDTILSRLPAGREDMVPIAARWLLNNMSWHMARLSGQARFNYASAAAKALGRIDDRIWNEDLAKTENGKNIWPIASRLRSGDVWGQIDAWERADINRAVSGLTRKSNELTKLAVDNKAQLRTIWRSAIASDASEMFEALVASRG